MRIRLCSTIFVLVALAGLLFASGAATQNGSGSQAAFFRDLAAQDRAHAADAGAHAKQWEDMAAKAEARAAAASGALKQTWEQSANDDLKSAGELRDEQKMWEAKARDLDAQADQAEKEAAANQLPSASSSPASPVSPAGAEKTATGNAGGTPETPAAPAAESSPGPSQLGARGMPPGGGVPGGGAPGAPRPADRGASGALSLQDVLGYWRATSDPSFPFVILSAAGPKNPPSNELIVHTRGRVWKGSYSANSSGPLVSVRYTPAVEEINHDIPLAARKAVQGKLVWRIELQGEGDDIDPVLQARWFPGEVKWREDAPGSTATVLGDGTPHEFDLEPDYSIRVDELEQPTLGLKLATAQDYDSDANQVEALVKGQRFFPRVTLPAEMARKQGSSLPVTLKGLTGNSSDEVELKSLGQVGIRPVVYTTDDPVTIADCGVLEPPRRPKIMSAYWILQLFGGKAGQCLNLTVTNGEKVELRYLDTFMEIPVYESWVQRGLARQRQAVAKLRSALQAVFAGPYDRISKDDAHKRIRMLANYELMYGSDKLTDLHRFYLGELYFGDAMGPAIVLMTDAQLGTYYGETLNGPREQTDPTYFNPLVKAYLEGLTGKDLTPKATTAASDIVWTSPAEQFLAVRTLRTTSDRLAANAVKTWVEDFAFGGYEGIAAATQAGQLYVIATGTDHHGEPVSGWDRLFAAVNLASNAVLSFTGTEFAQELLATRSASRLGSGLEQESLLVGDISRGVKRLDGDALIPDLPKSLSAAEREALLVRTTAELHDEGVAVNCALRGGSETPRSLVDTAILPPEIPVREKVEEYVHAVYGSEASFVGGWSEHPILPLQGRDRPTCAALSANYLIYKYTGRVITESSAQKAIIQIMKEQLTSNRKGRLVTHGPGGKIFQREVRTLESFKVAPGFLDGFDELSIRDYLRANGAKVAQLHPAGNKNLKLRHIWSALEKGYGVRVTIGIDKQVVAGGVARIEHEYHSVVVDGLIVGTRGGRPAVKAVRIYDSNVGRLIEVPAETFDRLLARDIDAEKGLGIMTLVKFKAD